MNLMCRGSEKYFVLMLYRLFSAELEKIREGNVNLIWCPKSSFLSSISMYFSMIGLGKQII